MTRRYSKNKRDPRIVHTERFSFDFLAGFSFFRFHGFCGRHSSQFR